MVCIGFCIGTIVGFFIAAFLAGSRMIELDRELLAAESKLAELGRGE